MSSLPKKIISGGQTGADRAALDWALAHRVPHGGWCPAGRKAEDGVIDDKYELSETTSTKYHKRTERNVLDADATLIVNMGELDGGSLSTQEVALRAGKPVRVVQLDAEIDDATVGALRVWLESWNVLNVAGPRESKRAGIHDATYRLLTRIWAA